MALIVTPGTSYTWATASWSWDDVRADKSWDEAYSAVYLETDAEAFTASDARAALATVIDAEAVAVSEARRAEVALSDLESLALGEVYADFMAYLRQVAETFSVAEASANIIAFTRIAQEAIALTEQRAVTAFKALAEAVAAADAASRAASYQRASSEALSASDAAALQLLKTFGELIQPVEQPASLVDFSRDTAEGFAISENYIDLIGFINASLESIGVAELRQGEIAKPVAEALGLSEASRKELSKFLAEAVAASDTYIDLIGFLNAITESVGISESRRATVGKRSAESVAALDRLVRRANAVIADLAIRSSGMTQQEFADRIAFRKPLGNYPPKPLQPGDYRYERAIIGILLEDLARTSRVVSLDTAKLTVDVPDVTDRGTAVLTSSGATITFTRSFYDPPEIQVIQTAGSTRAIASVNTITTSGFFVQLFDAATATVPVAGTISWTALGK